MSHLLEGRSSTLERGADCPADPRGTLERGGDRSAGSRGMRMGRKLGFFESFAFFPGWKEAVDLRGPNCLNMCLRF